VVEGRRLTFRLAGINNQNFVMRDEQTGSWWQQVSGRAIEGPLKGKRLELVPHDQLTFATWRAESPKGRVLMQDKAIVDRDEYEPSDWEDYVEKYPVRVAIPPGGPIPPRTLIVGITLKGKSKAWPHASVLATGATIDQVAGVPVLIVVSPDGRSVRAFDRRVRGQALSFIRAGRDIGSSTLLDLETMSEWDFSGRATAGDLAGAQLGRIEILLDYWFDWKTYHPDTEVLKPWRPAIKKAKPTAIPKPNDDAKVPADPKPPAKSKK
jgi:Protein of unknown function (DUF3179)